MHYDAKVIARLKRIEGQLRGVLRMMDEGQACHDVIYQLSAVRSAVDRTMGVVVTDNLVDCLTNDEASVVQKDQVVKQAVNLLLKSR